MRKYQLIWETLKGSPTIPATTSIVASTDLHSRIIQGVRKEKWRDDAHKLLLAESELKTHLIYTTVDETILFELTYLSLTFKRNEYTGIPL